MEEKRKLTFIEMKQLVMIMKPLLPLMLLTIILGTLGYLAITAISVIGGMAIIQISHIEYYESLATLLSLILLFALLRAVFRLSEQYCTHYIAFRLLAIIRDKIFAVVRSLRNDQIKSFQKGEFMNIVTKDVELLEVFYAHTIAPIFIGIATTIIYTFFFYNMHPLYALIALISYVTISYIVPKSLYVIGNSAAEQHREDTGKLNNFLLDSLKGIKEILLFQFANKTSEEIDNYSKKLNHSTYALKKHEGILTAFTDSSLYLFVFLHASISIYLYANNEVTGATALVALFLYFSSFGPSLALSQLSASLVHTFASAKRVLQLINIPSFEIREEGGMIQNIDCIEVNEMTFAYENENPLYSNVTFKWNQGDIIGIKGENGVGKSTLISLLLQDLSQTSGQIKMNERNVAEVCVNNLRKQFAFVDARTVIFSDTIRNNVALYNDSYSDEEIFTACKKAGLEEFIYSLPEGLGTYMNEYAANISSGQLQRIALARLFLKEASVYILDEPTSNLDSLNENYILQSVKENAKDKIVVIISHNDSVLSIANKVYEIKDNKVMCVSNN